MDKGSANTKIIEMVEFYSGQMGFNVETHYGQGDVGTFIKISNSDFTYRVRMANTDLPESHSVLKDHVDFEITHRYANKNTWYDCIAWLAKQIKQPVPEFIDNLINDRNNKNKELETQKLNEVVDRQFNYILTNALSKCLQADKKLYSQYKNLQSKIEKAGQENCRERSKYDKKFKNVQGQIIILYG